MARRFDQELIVVTKPPDRSGVENYADGRVAAALEPAVSILERAGLKLRPLFPGTINLPNAELLAQTSDQRFDPALPDELARFYFVSGDSSRFAGIVEDLNSSGLVEGAYLKNAAEPPNVPARGILNAMQPRLDAPADGQQFQSRQDYLKPAPAGIDAEFAWQQPGGKGAGIRIIDCEWGWNFDHEDLRVNQRGVVIGENETGDEHGTAVVGVISGDVNPLGITGISSDAIIAGAAFGDRPTAQVIREAADRLMPGDTLLLEIHRPGPRANDDGQFGYIAIEWWPDDLAAIRYAVGRGLVVVEAAGNGHQNLDDAIYGKAPRGFPPDWRNPFNPANPTSGAVMVGAGNPPSGTHGLTREPEWDEDYVDRARCDYSNFGRRLDCQGWGWQVTTTGYGDLQGGPDPNIWYTDSFSGTSSASPIVVGAIANLQGILRARRRPLLSSPQIMHLLRSTGSPQQDAPGRPRSQRIGNRPDLRQLIAKALGEGS